MRVSALILLFSICGTSTFACEQGSGSLSIGGENGAGKVVLSSWDCSVKAWKDAVYVGENSTISLYRTTDPSDFMGEKVFVSPISNGVSEDGKTLRIQRVVNGLLYFDDGSRKTTENSYCDVINLTSGCVTKSLPAENCAGRWVGNKWRLFSSAGQRLEGEDLETISPKSILQRVSAVKGDKDKALAISDYLYMGLPSYFSCYPPEIKDSAALNDLGFYLYGGGDLYNALGVFRRVELIDPSRLVLKLNIADALWDKGQRQDARGYYKEYQRAMLDAGRKEKIPSRVYLRQSRYINFSE